MTEPKRPSKLPLPAPEERAFEAAQSFPGNRSLTIQGGFSTKDLPTDEEPFLLTRRIVRNSGRYRLVRRGDP